MQHNTSINLSRLAITGAATLSTPIVVLKEIADAHAIEYDINKINQTKYLTYFVNIINTQNVNSIKQPYDMKEYRLIGRFINKDQSMSRAQLMRCFDLLMEYTKIEKLTEPHINFKYGIQTPDEPDKLNACVLFGICKANRIETRSDSTLDEMASNIKLLFSLRNPSISHSIRTAIIDNMMYGGCEGYQLINVLSLINPLLSLKFINNNITENSEIFMNHQIEIKHDELVRVANNIRLRNIRTKPRSPAEAVAMAAIYHKIDISEVRNPLAEFQELTRSRYIPLDPVLINRLKQSEEHPDIIANPRLNVTFNPNLPCELYDNDDLITMCLNEGYSETDTRMEEPYTILQTAYLMPTFFHGRQEVDIMNKLTTLADEVDELEYDNVILFLNRSENNNARVYTYGELASTFASFKRFQKPDGNNEMFTMEAINKLSVLCGKDQYQNESENSFMERLELGREIDNIKLYMDDNHEQVRQFIARYEQFSSENQQKIRDFIELLLKCGMYMRGWSGEGPYLLTAISTNVPADEQPNIELRVTQSIGDLESCFEEMNLFDGDFGNLAKELPLMFYNSRNNELLPSTNEEEGLTIYDRINIVKGGDDGSIQSCIRMSSNRFISSAYYYMKLMSMPITFNIADLDHIQ